jgi:hypothetical protein
MCVYIPRQVDDTLAALAESRPSMFAGSGAVGGGAGTGEARRSPPSHIPQLPTTVQILAGTF